MFSESSEVTSNPSVYDEKTVELLGQTYLVGSPPRLLVVEETRSLSRIRDSSSKTVNFNKGICPLNHEGTATHYSYNRRRCLAC